MAGLSLVTGATGFAGSHLLDSLLEEEAAVAAWANPGGRHDPPAGDTRVSWRGVDILDAAAVTRELRSLRPAVIYHCAGVPHVAESWANPSRALQVNVVGTHRILEGLRAAGHECPVLIVGSALVYRPSAAALTEDAAIGPSTPYGVSKLAQEMVGARAGDLPVYLARPFNHAGPRQSAGFVTSSFAKQIAEIEAWHTEPILRVGNLDSRRDITDVRDTVLAYRLIVRHGRPQRPYNVCAGRAYRIADLLDILVNLSSVRVRVEADPARMRPSDTPVVLGDRARIGAEAGWAPAIGIERTLADLLDYWRRAIAHEPMPRP